MASGMKAQRPAVVIATTGAGGKFYVEGLSEDNTLLGSEGGGRGRIIVALPA